jgi:hypothetical protein
MDSRPRYFQILVVDIESFGSRTNPVQQHLRVELYRIIREAMAETGISMAELPISDRGDGAFWLLPASVSKVDLTGRFVTALRTRLDAYAQVSNARAALRLRVVLHAGEVASDERGWVGADLNTACRLVDLQELRDTLAANVRSRLVLAVSDPWYSAVVRHDYPGIDRSAFWPVAFHAKEVRQTAWLSLPGYDRPPRTGPGDQQADPVAPADQGGPVGPSGPAPTPAAEPGPAPVTYSGPFAQATVIAGEVYAGDRIEYGGETGRG